MGISYRFFLRWFVEASVSYPFFPATLNSGDTYGIATMEFPMLPISTALLFVMGPFWGKVFANFFVILVIHILVAFNIMIFDRRENQIRPFYLCFLLLTSFCFGWTGKYMPDLISVLLTLLAVAYFRIDAFTKAIFFASLGILMKPTSAIVLLLLAVLDEKDKVPARLRRAAIAVIPVLIGFLYYTVGIKWIRSVADPSGFAVDPRPFLGSLKDALNAHKDFFKLMVYRSFFSLGFPLVIGLSGFSLLFQRPKLPLLMLWICFALQIFVILGLAGTHAFTHDYYFMGAAPTACLILGTLLQRIPSRLLQAAFLFGMLIPTVEISLMNLRSLYREPYRSQLTYYSECAELKAKHPEFPWNRGIPFQSSPESYPALGLCFGERQDSKVAAFGFFYRNDENPASEKCTEIVDRSTHFFIAKCK